MNKNTIIYILITILVLGSGVGAYFYLQSDLSTTPPRPEITQPPRLTSPPTQTPPPTPTIPDDWEIYTSQEYNFQIGHPPEIEIDVNPQEGVRLLLMGPTQGPATELSDGILLMIVSGAYDQDSFLTFVESRTEQLGQDQISAITSAVEPTEISSLSGYSFEVTSLGTSTYYYLDRGDGKYLRIIEYVQDPTDQGFQQIVDQIYSSLTLI